MSSNTNETTTTIFPISSLSLRILVPFETSFFVLLNFCLFILLCIRFHSKPVKAHGRLFLLSRLLGSTLLFLRYVVVYAIEGEDTHGTNIWEQIRAFGNVLLIVVVPPMYCIPLFLQFWRILHVFEYNRLKSLISNEQEYQKFHWRCKFHQFAISIWFHLIVIFISLFICSIVFIIGTVLAFVTNLDITTYFVAGVGGTIAIVVSFGLLLIVLSTLIRQSKAPYHIYTTAIVSIILGAIFGVTQIGGAIKSRIPTDISYLVFNIFSTAIPLHLMMWDTIIVVGVPIIQSFIYHSSKTEQTMEQNSKQLDSILSNNDVQKLFLKFCLQEWSSENFLFLKQYSEWKRIESVEEKLLRARVLFSIFLDKNAPLQLNTTFEKIDNVSRGLQMNDLILLEVAFLAVVSDAQLTMSDTFSRFCFYEPYVKYLRRNSAHLDATKQVGWN